MAHRRPGRRRRRRSASSASKRSGPAPTQQTTSADTEAVAALDPLIGTVLGRCRIEARIGEGRTSVVYRARHEALDATVAVKLLLPRTAANPQLLERFHTEARAIARIDNENVLKIYDVGTEGSRHFIVMELLEGEEVLDLVSREGQLDVMDALRITRQAANGLATAHTQGIVHRDVKPQNLVLLEDGTVKVVDFGLAAGVEEGGERVGTPHFMAPETCESGETSAASDIYSLGISLYLMLVGKPPYAGKDVRSIFQAHIRGEPLHPERQHHGIPKEASELVRRLTALSPDDRPTARQAIEELDGFGGEALQEKSTLRRRRSRMRAHMAAKRQSTGGPLLVATILVIGAIVAVIVLGSQGDENGPASTSSTTRTTSSPPPAQPVRPRPPPADPTSQPPPPPPPTQTPTRPPPPPPKPLTPEEKAAEALAVAEDWARENWRSRDDDPAVIAKYRTVESRHAGTEAAKEAFERVRGIMRGRVHPHPDKKLASADEVAAASREWEENEPQVEELIAKHLYFRARSLVPKVAAQDAGQLGQELRFWKAFVDHLVDFRTGLMSRIPDLPEERRKIETPKGEGVVLKATDQYVTVQLDGKEENLLWTDVTDAQLAALGQRAFQEAEPRYMLNVMAFAFAHRVWSAFWATDLDLGMRELDSTQEYMVEEYRRRLPERQTTGGG